MGGTTASPPRRWKRILSLPIIALVTGFGAVAHAQLPLPFGPEPDFGKRLQCARDYVRSVEKQAAMLEKLRTSGPEAVGRLCTLIEKGSAWLGGELPDSVRQELRSLLGVDIDLERLKTQCRLGQDTLDREIAASLAQLKAELARCDDTI